MRQWEEEALVEDPPPRRPKQPSGPPPAEAWAQAQASSQLAVPTPPKESAPPWRVTQEASSSQEEQVRASHAGALMNLAHKQIDAIMSWCRM